MKPATYVNGRHDMKTVRRSQSMFISRAGITRWFTIELGSCYRQKNVSGLLCLLAGVALAWARRRRNISSTLSQFVRSVALNCAGGTVLICSQHCPGVLLDTVLLSELSAVPVWTRLSLVLDWTRLRYTACTKVAVKHQSSSIIIIIIIVVVVTIYDKRDRSLYWTLS